MALQDQVNSRQALSDLKHNTLNFLANTRLTAGGLVGVDTYGGSLGTGVNAGTLYIGTRVFVTNSGVPADGVVTTQGLATPMRTNVALNRLAATGRFNGGNHTIWVTTRQTGCSVLIQQWQNGSYSMVHLQPYGPGQYSGTANYLFGKSTTVLKASQGHYLRNDVTAVSHATATLTGDTPRRYILVQSSFSSTSHYLQVVGVQRNGSWDFYSQTRDQLSGALASYALTWRGWSAYVPYIPAHF